jgi:hypothetical protein
MDLASTAMGREAGRSLLTLANLITALAPVAADWNDSHIFNQRWPSHARFHGVVALAMTSGLASLNLWSLWSPATDRRTRRLFAAAVPVGYWAPFLVAPLVPGTGWMTRRTRFPGSRACRPACWARPRPPAPPSPAGCWIDVPADTSQPDRGLTCTGAAITGRRLHPSINL